MNKIEYTNEFPTEKAKLMYEQGYGVSDYISIEKQGYPNLCLLYTSEKLSIQEK